MRCARQKPLGPWGFHHLLTAITLTASYPGRADEAALSGAARASKRRRWLEKYQAASWRVNMANAGHYPARLGLRVPRGNKIQGEFFLGRR